MHDLNPLMLIDYYKADHRSQYPDGTTLVYNNFTPRVSRVPGVNYMTLLGLQ
jgi:nicotinamide phosphoribosyltransferase